MNGPTRTRSSRRPAALPLRDGIWVAAGRIRGFDAREQLLQPHAIGRRSCFVGATSISRSPTSDLLSAESRAPAARSRPNASARASVGNAPVADDQQQRRAVARSLLLRLRLRLRACPRNRGRHRGHRGRALRRPKICQRRQYCARVKAGQWRRAGARPPGRQTQVPRACGPLASDRLEAEESTTDFGALAVDELRTRPPHEVALPQSRTQAAVIGFVHPDSRQPFRGGVPPSPRRQRAWVSAGGPRWGPVAFTTALRASHRQLTRRHA